MHVYVSFSSWIKIYVCLHAYTDLSAVLETPIEWISERVGGGLSKIESRGKIWEKNWRVYQMGLISLVSNSVQNVGLHFGCHRSTSPTSLSMGTNRSKINHIKLVYVIPKSSSQLSKFLVFSMSYQSVLNQRECKKKQRHVSSRVCKTILLPQNLNV